jgi:protein SCO1/2
MKPAGCAAVTAVMLVCSACRSHTAEFPDYGVVTRFELTLQNGQPFDSAALAGKIWVANFFFTTCPGPCPRMIAQMHQIQEATWRMPDVRLVSLTVDPARDTPQRLTVYAAAHHASHKHWYFLTGPQATLDHLGFDVFRLNHVDGTLQHSTRFVLIDKQSHIRGFYDTSDTKSIPKLVADIHALGREPV